MLCTSGFVDDVIFSHFGLRCVVCIPKWQQNMTNITGKILITFCLTSKTGNTHCELCTGGKIGYLRLSCKHLY